MKNKSLVETSARAGYSLALLLFILLFDSCASLSKYKGVGRIRRYTIEQQSIPAEFDGFTIAFLSDTHYPSKFTRKRLAETVRALNDLSPDLILLGGDYMTDLSYADELFASIGSSPAPYGTHAVLGNHDTRNADTLCKAMLRNGISPLRDTADTISIDGARIFLCGVENYRTSDKQWVERHTADGFTIVAVHSPDYACDYSLGGNALQLSGHTHGGQVTLLGLYAPETNSKYGRRFLSGLNYTTKNIPVITSNGLGTSRRKIRFCAPSDIIFVTLQHDKKKRPRVITTGDRPGN